MSIAPPWLIDPRDVLRRNLDRWSGEQLDAAAERYFKAKRNGETDEVLRDRMKRIMEMLQNQIASFSTVMETATYRSPPVVYPTIPKIEACGTCGLREVVDRKCRHCGART